MAREAAINRIPIRDLVRYYLRLGVLGFGGPVALVGQMERELVGEKNWLTKEEMREGIAVCQSLPGPLAIQVGIWISYIRGGFWGAWAGGWAFILPNFIIVAILGALYVRFEGLPAVAAIFYGCEPGRYRVDPSLVLPADQVGHEGLAGMGARDVGVRHHGRGASKKLRLSSSDVASSACSTMGRCSGGTVWARRQRSCSACPSSRRESRKEA